jgi:hypothetical protein
VLARVCCRVLQSTDVAISVKLFMLYSVYIYSHSLLQGFMFTEYASSCRNVSGFQCFRMSHLQNRTNHSTEYGSELHSWLFVKCFPQSKLHTASHIISERKVQTLPGVKQRMAAKLEILYEYTERFILRRATKCYFTVI